MSRASDDRNVCLIRARENARKSRGFGAAFDLARAPRNDFGFDVSGIAPLQKRLAFGHNAIAILKTLGATATAEASAPDEQIFLAIVLEPTDRAEVGPDLQQDVYSCATIRAAKESYDANARVVGLQHTLDITEKTEVLDSFIMPADSVINGQTVYAGSWLVAIKVLDGELWASVRSGAISGVSIGATGNRTQIT
jgi:hypothetical protein